MLLSQLCFLMTLAILIFASYKDIKTRTVSNITILTIVLVWLLLSIYSLLLARTDILEVASKLIQALFVFAIFLAITCILEKVSNKELFGGGDIKIIGALSLNLEISGILLMLLIASIISLLVIFCRIVFKKNDYEKEIDTTIAWIPCITFGYAIVNVGLFL